jgi:hypothetical protein
MVSKMAGSLRSSPRSLLLGCTVLLAFLFAAPAAHGYAEVCEGQVLEQPFVPWSDDAAYTLVPDGDLTGGGAGWVLDGADVIDDNEPWYVHGGTTPAAVRLGDGAAATTPPICVTPEHPTMRFFVRNTGGAHGELLVEVVLEDGQAIPIGVVPGSAQGEAWAPSPILPILANETEDAVAFRFTAIGYDSQWVVDDVYVDPDKKG